MKVILVGGRAGEGKTSFTNFCMKMLDDLVTYPDGIAACIPFAKKVKDTAKFMGWNGVKDDKGRRLLQVIGGAGRDYNPNTWVSAVADSIVTIPKEFKYVFVDDWRFPNELDFMRDAFNNDVISVRLWRQEKDLLLYNTPMWDDPSEVSLPLILQYYDVNINNFGDIANLEFQARRFVQETLTDGGKI